MSLAATIPKVFQVFRFNFLVVSSCCLISLAESRNWNFNLQSWNFTPQLKFQSVNSSGSMFVLPKSLSAAVLSDSVCKGEPTCYIQSIDYLLQHLALPQSWSSATKCNACLDLTSAATLTLAEPDDPVLKSFNNWMQLFLISRPSIKILMICWVKLSVLKHEHLVLRN